jgi:hypothetical protein
LDAEDDEGEEASEVPSNIVLFPGVPVVVSNIIPFPLMGVSVAAEEQGATAEIRSAVAGVEDPEPELPLVLVPNHSATFNAQSPELQAPASKSENLPDGGIDVASLGLKPVTERESAEPSRSVSLTPPPANVVPPNEATAVNSSSNVIEVAFREAAVARGASESAVGSQAQLPGETTKLAESAPSFSSPESSAKIVLLRTDAAKTAAGGGFLAAVPLVTERLAAAGTGAAKQGVGMESTMTSEREKVAADGSDTVLEVLPQVATTASGRDGSSVDLSTRTSVAMEWQVGRSTSAVERSGSDSLDAKSIDGTATVERISSLMVRESALVKKHGSDSMAVVLRPDAETELFVHLSLRDGQIEATVRLERGDAQHLGALWSQLQESLAQHKVRLAPLQDAPSGQSNFNQSPGSGMSGGQNGMREETRPEKQFMDERSAPAASQSTAPHVRGLGGSRSRRITTSRPGWETWA